MANKTLPPMHLLCSEDELRPNLCYVEILDGVATATNGMLIGKVNMAEYSKLDEVTIMRLSGKYIHRDVWKLIHDADEITAVEEDESKISYLKGGIEASIAIKDGSEIQFPNHHDLIKKIANAKYGHRSFIAFNPRWIEISRKLFGSENLIIRFYESEGLFVCFPGTDAKAFIGIMMQDFTAENATFDFMV